MTGTAVTLALLASLTYGAGTALSRTAVRQHTASSVALWVQTVGFVALALAAVIVRPAPSAEAVLLGVTAGALAACGVLAFYTAMQNGPISLVAPVAASGVAVPVAGGLLLGEQVSRSAFAGLVLVIVGVMVISRSHDGATPTTGLEATGGGLDTLASPPGRSQVTPVHDNCKPSSFAHPHRVAVALASTSAAAFGVFYLVLREAAAAAPSVSSSADVSTLQYPIESAVLVALAVQGGSLLVTLATASRHTIRCVRPTRRLVTLAFMIGMLDVSGDLALTYAVAVGPIALVGPLGSLDPIVVVLLAWVFFREPLTVKRAVGLAACAVGIALVPA